MNPGAYLLTANCFLPALGVPVANPRCPMALHRVEVCVLPNHLELLQHKHRKAPLPPSKTQPLPTTFPRGEDKTGHRRPTWWTRCTVGARNTTIRRGVSPARARRTCSRASMMATMVFPEPVSSTAMVFPRSAAANTSTWYLHTRRERNLHISSSGPRHTAAQREIRVDQYPRG